MSVRNVKDVGKTLKLPQAFLKYFTYVSVFRPRQNIWNPCRVIYLPFAAQLAGCKNPGVLPCTGLHMVKIMFFGSERGYIWSNDLYLCDNQPLKTLKMRRPPLKVFFRIYLWSRIRYLINLRGGISPADWYIFQSNIWKKKNVEISFLSSIKVFILTNVYIFIF